MSVTKEPSLCYTTVELGAQRGQEPLRLLGFLLFPVSPLAGNFFAKDLVVSEKLPIFATDILTFNFLSIWKQRKEKERAKRWELHSGKQWEEKKNGLKKARNNLNCWTIRGSLITKNPFFTNPYLLWIRLDLILLTNVHLITLGSGTSAPSNMVEKDI